MADANYLIHKEVKDGATLTYVDTLSGDGLVNEIARLCGGVSEAGQLHARDIISSANEYKSKFNTEYDKIENRTWYFHKNMPYYINDRSCLLA